MVKSARQHLRAPVHDDVLYVCEDYVLRGKCDNISEGGLLLTELGKVPDNDSFSILLPLIQYPEIAKLSTSRVISTERTSLDIEIVRAKIQVVRSYDELSEVQKILLKNIGTQFVGLASSDAALIKSFVETFSRNLVHLLTLFESNSTKGENLVYLRKVASLLGYDGSEKISLLRQKVLHDYQSLESL